MASVNTLLNNTPGTGTSTKTTTDTSGSTSKSQLDASKLMGTTDQFLTILLAQLKHQDPLEPMKGTEFIDSISRLSGVEQSINTNKNLENISSILKGEQMGSPVSYLDKNIEFNSSQFALTGGVSDFSYNLDSSNPPESVSLVIKDASGNVVVTTKGTTKPGLNSIKWDGTDMSGNQLGDGLYTVEASYTDPKTKDSTKPVSISIPTITFGKVTGADFTGDNPMLNVGGISIPLSAVRSIRAGV